MPNSNQINNLSPNFRDLLLNMNLPLRDTVVDNSLTTYLNGVGKPFVVNHINKLPDNNNLEDIGDIQLPFSVRKNEYQGESKDYEKRGITTSNDFTNPLEPYSLTSVGKLNPVPIIFAKTPASKIKEGLTPFSFLTSENKYKTNVAENKFNSLLDSSKSTQVDISLKNIYASPQDNSIADVSAMAKTPNSNKPSYLDDKGNLNLGGGSTQPFDIISSVVSGGGFGLNSQGGIIDNADIRSSLAGRALTGLGIINDTPLGVIGGKQLLIQLGNNAIKNVQKESLGKINTDVLSLLKGGDVLKPNYEITIPSSGLGKVLDFGADLLGFQLPISVLSDSASIWSFDDNLDPTNPLGIVRANEMLKNSGKGQVLALFKQMKANLTGKCRPGYAPAFEDERIPDAIKPNEYSTGDKLVRHGSKSGLGIDVFAGNYDRRRKVIGNSVLEDTGHVKIARYPSDDKDTKRYMFSIENLAYSDNLLKACEKGPYGGKIMWFPPYDISFSEQSNVNWEKTYFIGRGEPMFTYNNTERTGNLSWKIIIDFPNYAQQFTNSNNDTINGFYAGCWDDKKSAVKPKYEVTIKANQEVKKEEASIIQDKPETKTNTEPIKQEDFRVYFPNDVYEIDLYPNYENGLMNPKNKDIYLKAISNIEKNFIIFYNKITKNIDRNNKAYKNYSIVTLDNDNSIKNNFNIFKNSIKNDITTLNGIPNNYFTDEYSAYNGFKDYYDEILTTYPYKNFKPSDLPKMLKIMADTTTGGEYFPTTSVMYKYYENVVKAYSPSSDISQSLFKNPDGAIYDDISKAFESWVFQNDDTRVLNSFSQHIELIKNIKLALEKQTAPSSVDEIDYKKDTNGDGYGYGTTLTQGVVSNPAGQSSADNTNFGLNGKGNKTSKDRGNIITVENVHYDGWWDPNLKPALKKFLTNTCPHCKIYINGYASIQGGKNDKNTELSQKRADNIKEGFLKDIIDKDDKLRDERIVTSTGKGATEGNSTEKCEGGASPDKLGCKRNRFVSIKIVEDENLKKKLNENEKDIVQNLDQPIMQVTAKKPDPIPEKSIGYSECDYFEKLNKNHNFIYEQLREKIKHFSPSFHSTTPEGFNSRLTFLHQCTRQGSTIYDEKPDNLAFGKPPVCILRLGDFYYTKIIIDSISFTYEPLVWDMNPEGIGMQPMIANVDMSFSFIGGSSMDGPIVRLQNAISHNFYANTNVYDDRAETNAKDTENEPELPNIKSEYKPLKLAADTEVRTMGEKNLQDIKLNIEYDNSGFSKGNLYGTISIEKESDRDLNIVLSVKNQDIMSILLKKGKKSVKFKTEKNMGRYPWDEYFYAFFLKEGQQYGVVDFNLDIIEESVKKQFLYNWEPYFKGDKNDLNGGKLSPKAPDAPLPVNNNVKPEDKTEVDPKAKTEQDATEQKKKEKEALEKENYDKISTELIVKSKEDDNYGYGEGTGIDLDAATIKANEDSKIDFLNKKSVNTTISKTTPIVPIEEIDKKVLTNSSGNVTVIVVNKYTIIK